MRFVETGVIFPCKLNGTFFNFAAKNKVIFFIRYRPPVWNYSLKDIYSSIDIVQPPFVLGIYNFKVLIFEEFFLNQ